VLFNISQQFYLKKRISVLDEKKSNGWVDLNEKAGAPASWLIGRESKDGGFLVDWSIDNSNN
jgi:hypothetical protein